MAGYLTEDHVIGGEWRIESLKIRLQGTQKWERDIL